jgi:hypothetical protein
MIAVDASFSVEPHLVGALQALAAPGRTLGLVGADQRTRAAVIAALAGAAVLHAAVGALVPLPDGGAVIDISQARPSAGSSARTVHARPRATSDALSHLGSDPAFASSEHLSIQWDNVDESTSMGSSAARSTWADAR